MDQTLLIDVSAVCEISGGVLSIADSLAAMGRPLRLAMPSPAPDPYSLRISAQLTHRRATLGLAACDAADELTRMAEIFVGTAHTMAGIARWTSVGMLGLVAPSANHPVGYSRRTVRAETPNWAQDNTWTPQNDDEVLSCAVLLNIGDPDLSTPWLPDAAALQALGDTLATLGERLLQSWPGGSRPAAMLNRFGEWIRVDYRNALQHSVADVELWATEYMSARAGVAAAAADYTAARQAALDGEERSVASEAARQALDRYAGWSLGDWDLADFPRLVDGS